MAPMEPGRLARPVGPGGLGLDLPFVAYLDNAGAIQGGAGGAREARSTSPGNPGGDGWRRAELHFELSTRTRDLFNNAGTVIGGYGGGGGIQRARVGAALSGYGGAGAAMAATGINLLHGGSLSVELQRRVFGGSGGGGHAWISLRLLLWQGSAEPAAAGNPMEQVAAVVANTGQITGEGTAGGPGSDTSGGGAGGAGDLLARGPRLSSNERQRYTSAAAAAAAAHIIRRPAAMACGSSARRGSPIGAISRGHWRRFRRHWVPPAYYGAVGGGTGGAGGDGGLARIRRQRLKRRD